MNSQSLYLGINFSLSHTHTDKHTCRRTRTHTHTHTCTHKHTHTLYCTHILRRLVTLFSWIYNLGLCDWLPGRCYDLLVADSSGRLCPHGLNSGRELLWGSVVMLGLRSLCTWSAWLFFFKKKSDISLCKHNVKLNWKPIFPIVSVVTWLSCGNILSSSCSIWKRCICMTK